MIEISRRIVSPYAPRQSYIVHDEYKVYKMEAPRQISYNKQINSGRIALECDQLCIVVSRDPIKSKIDGRRTRIIRLVQVSFQIAIVV